MIQVQTSIKERLLTSINKIARMNDYIHTDYIYSLTYNIPAVGWCYILQQLSADFHFTLTDDFIDALEMCTFARLEELLIEYEGRR